LLLLVLILVLIAFGLLVVALLSGSVLWAWVSVGVSVAAAAVLLVDWLQRRSAVRAGAEAGDAVPTPRSAVFSPSLGGREPVVEPATEILPVVRADAPHGVPAEAENAVPDGRDERPDPQETVVLRAVAPPGSAEGPSGALDGMAPLRQNPSQSVTGSADDAAGSEHPGGPSQAHAGASSGVPATGADAEATVQVAGTATDRDPASGAAGGTEVAVPRGGASENPDGPPPGGGAADRRSDLPPLGPDGAPPEESHDADAAELVTELDDEVLVVDELPRYHLGGCRSLTGIPVIPLPAREAVELGFTPCAWCTPNRTLSSRHRAAAR
jgi:hypothetical protein